MARLRGRQQASTSTRTVHEQTLEITFLELGAEAYAFTFG
jgi:hypothetical protein